MYMAQTGLRSLRNTGECHVGFINVAWDLHNMSGD